MNGYLRTNNGILTIGDLKRMIELAKLSDDVQIVIRHDVKSDQEFFNVQEINLPDDDSYFALTLTTADTFDARQF